MKPYLREIAGMYHLPERDFPAVRISDEEARQSLEQAVAIYQRYQCVLYGGQSASPEIYGLTTLREHTSDLDFICLPQWIVEIVKHEPKLFYHPEYDIIFLFRDNLPVTFSLEHVHDCIVGKELIATSETVETSVGPVRTISREYSIVLKMRRSENCLLHQRRPFGKDALDILNILAGAKSRGTIIDFHLIHDLVNQYVSMDVRELKKILQNIVKYDVHLPRQMREDFRKYWEEFSAAVISEPAGRAGDGP